MRKLRAILYPRKIFCHCQGAIKEERREIVEREGEKNVFKTTYSLKKVIYTVVGIMPMGII